MILHAKHYAYAPGATPQQALEAKTAPSRSLNTSSKKNLAPIPHIVILHGFLGECGNWHSVAKALTPHAAITALDLRCHGKSPIANTINYDLMAKDVEETISQLNFTLNNNSSNSTHPLVLIGHSMGGKVAIKICELFSKNNPFSNSSRHKTPVGSLAGVIVADISPRSYDKLLFVKDVAPLYQFPIEKYSLRSEVEKALAPQISNSAVLKFLLKNISINSDTKKLAWRIPFNFLFENRDFLHQDVLPLNKISLPTLFLRGEKSNYITRDDEALINRYFTRSEISTIPNAGHWVHAENPISFLEHVKTFIKSV